MAAILTCSGMIVTSCGEKSTNVKAVSGILDEPFGEDSAPEVVKETMNTLALDDRYECTLNDSVSGVEVWSLMRCSDDVRSEGYGVVLVKGGNMTAFPDIHHGNIPSAHYDAASDELWLTGGIMEGTGTYVERPYLLRFDDEELAGIVASIDPYDMQQAIIQRLGYTIDGDDITFYIDGKALTTVTNQTDDMGEFDDEPIWIGEQLSYDINGQPLKVCFVPGLKFVTGLVLFYDDMPTINASVVMKDEGGFELTDFHIESEP